MVSLGKIMVFNIWDLFGPMTLFRYKGREDKTRQDLGKQSIEALYDLAEGLADSSGYTDIVVEYFTGTYRTDERHNLECVEQFYEFSKHGGVLLEADVEFEFEEGQKLCFSYDWEQDYNTAHIDSNSHELAEKADEAIPLEPTIPSRSLNYFRKKLGVS